ncbi:MAG: L,D-transpeptidase [Chloroflexi bacterium]|nr:L,D-transpeptidase [Chloroflexota bacterium]
MNPKPASPRKTLIFLGLILAIACAAALAAAWTWTSSPALGLPAEATPTHAPLFALAEIAKATYTSTPNATPTDIPTQTPAASATPEALAFAEIVIDTPTLEYSAPAQDNNGEIAAPSYGGNKYILVDISEQHMYVYEGDVLIYSFVSSTGMNNATRAGNFSVLNKIPNAYGATWNIWMPNWLGIYWAGSLQNGIHALPILPNGATLWEGYLGVPVSYGCVVLGTYESQLLYNWADIGTPVEIQW